MLEDPESSSSYWRLDENKAAGVLGACHSAETLLVRHRESREMEQLDG